MSWSATPPFISLTANLLHLRLRVERLKVAGMVQNLPAQLRAFGVVVPEQALRRKPVSPVTYRFPPIRHLAIRSSGEF